MADILEEQQGIDPAAPAAAGTSAPSPYDETLAIQDSQRQQKLRTSLVQADSQTPDRAADVQRLATQTGIPSQIIDRDYDTYAKRAKFVSTPFNQIVKESPALATWASEPQHAAVAHDDMEQLGALEWILKTPSRAVSQQLNAQGYGALRTKSLFGELTQEEHDQLESYRVHMNDGGELGAGNSWFRGAVTGSLKLLTQLASTVPVYGLAGAAGGAIIGGAGGTLVEPGGGTIVGAVAGARTGFAAGNLYGNAKMAFQLEAGGAYDEYLGLRDEFGHPMDPQAAKVAALATGAINAGLMTIGGSVVRAGLGKGAEKLLAGAFTRDAITAALRQPTVRAALTNALTEYGKTLAEGDAIVVAMRGVNILAGEIARSQSKTQMAPGQVEQGNIDLFKQPEVHNADGSTSTVDTVGVNINGKEYVLPTVTPDGRHLKTADEAIAEFQRTGKHLGAFETPDAGTAFAQQVHEDFAAGKYKKPDVGQELLHAAASGLQTFAIVGALGPAMGLAHDAQRAIRAEQNANVFKALGEGAKNSKTIARMPEAAQRFLETATKDGPVETIYAPVETWNQYWQSKGIDPAQVASDVIGSRDAYIHASQQGGDLAIPTARYATKLAATEHHAFFVNELRLGPDEMNAREGKAFADQLAASQAAGQVQAPAESPVRGAVLEQLTAAGIPTDTAQHYADLYESTVSSLAERAGIDPTALYERYGLKVTRPDLEAAGAEGPAKAPAAAVAATPGETAELAGLLGPGGFAGPERRQTAGAAPGGVERRQDQPLDLTDVGAAAARMRAENPNIDKEAANLRARAAASRAPAPPRTPKVGESAPGEVGFHNAGRPTEPGPAEARPGSASQEGPGAGGRPREQPQAGQSGMEQGAGAGHVAEPGRLPSLIDAGSPSDIFQRSSSLDASKARLTPEVTRELQRIVDELETFPHTARTWTWLTEEHGLRGNAAGGHANIVEGSPVADVYHDILSVSPLNRKAKSFMRSKARGTTMQVLNAARQLLATGEVHNNLAEGALRVAEHRNAGDYEFLTGPMLPPTWGEELPAHVEAQMRQALEDSTAPGVDLLNPDSIGSEAEILNPQGPVDTSFNINEFNQSLFDEVKPVDPIVDELATGELQPRLPGAGDVRGQENPTPAVAEAPFALTPEILKPRAGKQTELFQSVYHGTPHRFEEFSLQAIGSGEGYQAYGWGLYFAGNREVAEFYREKLAGPETMKQAVYDGTPLFDREIGLYYHALDENGFPSTKAQDPQLARGIMEVHTRSHWEPPGKDWVPRMKDALERSVINVEARLAEGGTFSGDVNRDRYDLQNYKDAIRALEVYGDKLEILPPEKPGHLLTVDVPDDQHYLDYDRLISQQSPEVQAKLQAMGIDLGEPTHIPTAAEGLEIFNTSDHVRDMWMEDIGIRESLKEGLHYAREGDDRLFGLWYEKNINFMREEGRTEDTGSQLYDSLQRDWQAKNRHSSIAESAKAASLTLASAGIAGIKYLDGNSRRKLEGSTNYVLFDPRLAKITEYNQSLPELTEDNVRAWTKEVKQKAGADLQGFSIELQPNGDLFLESLIVDRGAQRTGIGTAAMQELTRFADLNGRRITLTPAHRNEIGQGEPTSTGRLVKFYKRFGFVENAGRNRNMDLTAGMYREPTLPGPPDPTAPDGGSLIVQHNLTAANLLHAEKMGGLAVPSLAVAKAHDSLVNFGEITLLGPKDLADPKQGAKVFGADVYSPRYPTVHYKIPAAGEKRLAALFREQKAVSGQSYIDLDSLQKEGAKYLEQSPAVLAAFLASQDITVKPTLNKNGSVDQFDTRYEMQKVVDEGGHGPAFKAYAADLFKSLDATERIYKGFTNAGNYRYEPHTLERVVKTLKKDLRGGESQANIYGVGQLRSQFAPKFRSLEGVRKAADRIVSDADFEVVKAEVEADLFTISDALKSSYTHGDANRFGFVDTVMAVMADAPKRGLEKALKDYGFEDVPAETKKAIGDYINKLRDLPTEYFEVKHPRAMAVDEFRAAAVPEDINPEARAALERRGLEVATYRPGDLADRKRVVQELATNNDLLFQDQGGTKRGSIRFGPDRQFEIRLLEQADLSTFLHESGHFFLEILGDLNDTLGQVDPEKLTPQQKRLLSDYGGTLQALGVEGRDQIGTAHHEQFAKMFEAYLMEGRAPTLELQGAFSRFRAWLVSIYRSLSNLNVKLTPEVRGVLDRLVASDRAIQDAEARRGVPQMFLTPEQAGMSPAEFALYRNTIEDASRTAREELDKKLLGEVQREQTRVWKEQRADVQQRVEADVYTRPEYRALAAIQRGTHPNGEPLVEGLETPPMRLSRATLVERFGPERLKRLPPFVYSREGGLDPETVAGLFGYSSGDELLTALEKAGPMRAVIEAETSRTMIAEHGSLLLDGTLHEAAQGAIANEDREFVIRKELKALAQLRRTVTPFQQFERAQGQDALAAEQAERAYERRWMDAEHKLNVAMAEGRKQVEIDALQDEVSNLKRKARGGAAQINAAIPPAAVLKENAEARIAGLPIRGIKAEAFWSASRRAAQQAIDRAARQDFDGAIIAKQQELINLALYRAAERVQEDLEDRVRYAQGLSQTPARKRLGLAGANYLEQIDGILDRFEFARISQKQLDKRANIRAFADGLESQGYTVEIPESVLDEARRKNYQELTVEEFMGVTDALKQIEHLATLKNRLLKAADAREFAVVRDAVVSVIREKNPANPLPLEFRPGDERMRHVSDWFASHRKMSDIAQQLDGYADGGPVWEAFIRPINEAADVQAARFADSGGKLQDILERAYPKGELGTLHEKLHIPAIGGSLSKEARLAVALNWGNETSRQRLTSDPVRRWNQQQVEAILETLDRRDWAFVQDVWKFVDSFWPEIAAKQERVVGVPPEKVEGIPVRTKFGEIQGAYYPLKYDSRLSQRAAQNEAASQAKLGTQAAYVRSTTKRGHTETRLQNVKLPVRLELGVMFEHVEQVVHDLTHHEMLIDTTRLVRDPAIAKAILETRGDLVYQQLTRGLQDVAIGSTPPARNVLDKAANYMRTGTQIAMLGFNLWTGAQQPLGIFNGMARVGPKWVIKGMLRWGRDATGFENTSRWITDVSPLMKGRSDTATQDLHDLRVAFRTTGSWFDTMVRKLSSDIVTQQTITDSFLWHIGLMQRVADIPTWLGQYEKSMAAGEPETRAYRLADQAVLDAQGGGQVKDLAQVQRGGPVARLFMTFYSYGNTIFNATSREVGLLASQKTPAALGTFLGHLSLLYIAPALATVTLGHLFGKTSAQDTAEDWLKEIGKESLSTALNTMVLVRELGGLVQSTTRGYAGPAGARTIQLFYDLGREVSQGKADEGLEKALNAVAGVLFRYPAAQVQRTIDGYTALEEGRTTNPGVLLTGPPPKKK
jgi:ribosomal protein S18 acetylase RimI-like enzyme